MALRFEKALSGVAGRVGCQLVFIRPLGVIHHQNLYQPFLRFQFQPQLIDKIGEQARNVI